MSVEELTGRDLDAAVHVEVMGNEPPIMVPAVNFQTEETWREPYDTPHYGTSISDAWEVVERLVKEGIAWSFGITFNMEGCVTFQFATGEDAPFNLHHGVEETAAAAICVAALKAVRARREGAE